MLLIREFETKVDDLFTQGKITGTSHLCSGQEATAVGATAALAPGDYVASNHRGHGHFLARGGAAKQIMAELFGKATGYSGGRGGSQHMASFAAGFLGSNGITGGGIPVATGAALSLKLQKRGGLVLCFFGDGAANQGTFHESLNMAAIWRLPIVYLCENNLYAMSTPVGEAFAIKNIADRAAAYGMPGAVVDGNDVLAVKECVAGAAAPARGGQGPSLLECKTYRYSGHSKSDQREYRSAGEEEAWHARDPIDSFREKLMADGALSADRDEELRHAVCAEVEEAIEFAEQSPDPGTQGLEQSIFA